MRSPDSPTWTTRRLLTWTTDFFASRGIEHPRLSAEMLLAHVLSAGRLKLYLDMDRPASELERAAFRDLVERAARHEPVDYLVGSCPFYDLKLSVDPRVAIPRPSTETVVEHIVRHAKRTPGFAAPLVADIGTGSGAIAIAIAKHLPESRVIAIDLSPDALDVAAANARAHGVSQRIEFRLGDLLQPLGPQRVRYLASNPPYISDQEWAQVNPNVKDYEPESALRGGTDGLRDIRRILQEAHRHLEPPGQVVVEIAASQKDAALQIARDAGFNEPHVLADHEHLPRVLVGDTTA